jgi:hypothetical protein
MTSLSPVLEDIDTQDPDEVTHIVNQHLPGNSIADASIFGTEVVALCGHKFIPTRDPEKLPLCQACKLALEATT